MNTNKLLTLLQGNLTYRDKVKALFGSSIIAYWPLNEMTGTTALDHSGNGRNGTYSNVLLGDATSPVSRHECAPLFDGTNSWINILGTSLANAYNGDELTYCAWIKVYDADVWSGTERRILTIAGGVCYSFFRVLATNTIYFSHRPSESKPSIYYTVSSTDWMLMTATVSVSGGHSYLYQDKTQKATSADLATWGATVPTTMRIGGDATTPPIKTWKGWLSHLFILNRAMSPAELANLYATGYIPGGTTGGGYDADYVGDY